MECTCEEQSENQIQHCKIKLTACLVVWGWFVFFFNLVFKAVEKRNIWKDFLENTCVKLIFQAVLGSILKGNDGGSGRCSQATGLRAFSLFCRLSIHLQNKVWLYLLDISWIYSWYYKKIPKEVTRQLLNFSFSFQFSEEGKDYLSLLKETGAWIENQVVPFILASDQEDNISKRSNVAELIIQVRRLF